ncbi:hypothetical protein SYK_06740 [Pseudodesulfovibrio nedwellii]|uniref:Uncharacterized protein n=1 Tax=Pseudodesulfovibrio nedwellii TaxID=2973072 RepID=A0ABM8AXX5_9BACT|nr:hypothetical protein [Pseudodesulfovibrio nedwellii]BDQ36314.1 hypothetical protein SYK_06740 [Pseudodesulfovibrio nedwellii]
MPESELISEVQKRRIPIYLVTPFNLSMFNEDKVQNKYEDSTNEVFIGFAYVA